MEKIIEIHKCPSGFHGSLGESLSFDKCKLCGRNYHEEGFLTACKKLGIDPFEIDPFHYKEKF